MISFKVLNASKLKKELSDLEKRIANEVLETVASMARVEIETVAKRNVPVDSGRLRASILTITPDTTSYSYTDRKGNSFDGMLKSVNPTKTEVIVGTNVEYAERIHRFGGGGAASSRTSGGQKKPKGYGKDFLLKAHEKAVPRIIAAIKRIRGVQ